MHVKSLQIEEGIFDGVTLNFENGLNVLIGGRGVGKTSIIELLRFCLDATNFSDSSSGDVFSHALSILGKGRVSATFSDGGEDTVISRTASDGAQFLISPQLRPIVFSQKEIEEISTNNAGKRRLIDSFFENHQFDSEIKSASVEIRSLSGQLQLIKNEIDELQSAVGELPKLREQEKELVGSQKAFSANNQNVQLSQSRLEKLQKKINVYTVDMENINTYIEELGKWRGQLRTTTESPIREMSFSSEVLASLEPIRSNIGSAFKKVSEAEEELGQALNALENIREHILEKKKPLEDEARTLRVDINSKIDGAGRVEKDLSFLREKIARLVNITTHLSDKITKQKTLFSFLLNNLHRLSNARLNLFKARKEVIEHLNKTLQPNVLLELSHLMELKYYESALKELLKGSGLRYNDFVAELAKNISPTELAELVFSQDFKAMSTALGLSEDRCARILGHFSESDMGGILTAPIYDTVNFYLHDGTEYRPVEQLSIGQRCTVILSIVLEIDNRILIIDQPEDHLDNEYIARTLIRAIEARGDKSQTILSSHNANIPVLGNAQKVFQLASNGKRCYLKESGSLDDKAIVTAIKNVMEGGDEAFERRSGFYKTYG